MTRLSRWIAVGPVLALLVFVACEDLHLSAGNLDIGPNPASPGDQVVATFTLNLLPAQRHTIILLIDQEEHLRETSSDAPRNPVILELGDAADLIAAYGVGEHTVQVEVHVSGERAHTETIVFELRQAESGAAIGPGQDREEP